GRRVLELRFSGRTAGSVSQGGAPGENPGGVAGRPDDGEHRFPAAVSAANERSGQASGGNERGWHQSRRASRDTDPADSGSGDRAGIRNQESGIRAGQAVRNRPADFRLGWLIEWTFVPE